MGWALSYQAAVPLLGGTGFVIGPARVLGGGGLLLETQDGGNQWTVRDTGVTADLHDMVQLGDGSWLVVGSGGTVIKSTVQGVTWTQKMTGTTATLRSIATSGGVTVAVGNEGTTLRSNDNGETWCFLHSTLQDLYGIRMLNHLEFSAVGEQGTVVHTTNMGGACQSAPLELLFGDGFESGDAAAWSP